ncbi:aminodeoxychorismate synthase component I [Pelistega ratti]|uniref:aminodeoxychorismate synthase component I n=1 Tax=Pelistega ratti TaxID=2652177 RepID=UPI00135CD267|nr:aminodeoxychorismate synthase component I [Pelistega ratti]
MSFSAFIQQANTLGSQRIPFFFLIDFEKEKPIIVPLEKAIQQGIYYMISGKSNFTFPTLTDSPTTQAKEKFPITFTPFPISFAEYQKGFDIVQQELHKGNTYLLNLSYPTPLCTSATLADIFIQSQAKYKLWLDQQFVCFSPEPFIRTQHNTIYTYPMKGTIDATLDNAEQLLLNNEKEKREHYTVVDLLRNDLATVAHSIEVTRFRYIERISTARGDILQTSSEIQGQLDPHWQAHIGTLLDKLLPAGSISGAPKEKTVQIIQQAEGSSRGYYTGVFGLFDGKNIDSAVAIRFIEQRDHQFYFRSGGGITAQSDVEEEYKELIQKVYIPFQPSTSK